MSEKADHVAPLKKTDLRELGDWAERVVTEANGWAERAEASRGEVGSITTHADAIAFKARHIASLVEVLCAR